MKRMALLFALLAVAPLHGYQQPGTNAQNGPFGFFAGMTREEAVGLLGKGSIRSQREDTIISFATAPKPHPDFTEYVCLFSPKAGLLKIVAYSELIPTSGDGYDVRHKFADVREALVRAYGHPYEDFDFVDADSLFHEPKYFMMSLLKKERTLNSFWKPTSGTAHIQSLLLEALAEDTDHGQVTVEYEFDGFREYIEAKKKKADSVF